VLRSDYCQSTSPVRWVRLPHIHRAVGGTRRRRARESAQRLRTALAFHLGVRAEIIGRGRADGRHVGAREGVGLGRDDDLGGDDDAGVRGLG